MLKGDIVEEVGKLKQEQDGDIVVHGSARLVQTLIEHDLVDELRLMVYPVVLGSGKRLFGETSDKKPLRLVESKVVGDGVSILIYRPAGEDGLGVYALDMESGLLDSPERFEEYAQDALDSLPADLRAQMSNVEIVVEEEPPPGQRLLGLYQGVPLTRRGSYYGGVLPDKITIFRGPLMRLYAHDPERLRREVSRVVLHEVAHHFGISDERLVEIDRY